jgi:hypothetical protein
MRLRFPAISLLTWQHLRTTSPRPGQYPGDVVSSEEQRTVPWPRSQVPRGKTSTGQKDPMLHHPRYTIAETLVPYRRRHAPAAWLLNVDSRYLQRSAIRIRLS